MLELHWEGSASAACAAGLFTIVITGVTVLTLVIVLTVRTGMTENVCDKKHG